MAAIIYNDDIVQEVKESCNIVDIVGEHVNLKRTGVNFKGLCPFHNEKTPSFTVNQARNSYYCFGCSEGGDVFSFLMRFHNIDFPEALRQVAGRYNISLPEKPKSPHEQRQSKQRKEIYAVNQAAIDLYHQFLLSNPAAEPGRRYLKQRGIGDEIIQEFKLGFAPERWDFLLKNLPTFSEEVILKAGLIIARDKGGYYDRFRNRVLFPIFNISGKALGFGGRALGDQQPKYLNSPESPVYNKSKVVFGLFQNKDVIRKKKQCLVVEGNFDLLSLVANGIRNVGAPLGTALSRQHIKALKAYAQEAILLFDGDQAGIKAALRAVPLFLQEQLTAKVVVLPENHDPDTYIGEYGPDLFEKKLASALPLPEFVFDRLLSQHGMSLAGKTAIVDDLKPIITAIGDNQLQRSLFISHFGQKLGLTDEQMLSGLPNISNTQSSKKSGAETSESKSSPPTHRASLSMKEEQLLRFLIINPEYLSKYLEAGLEFALQGETAQKIVATLMETHLEKKAKEPEAILDMTLGPERSFISKCLLEIPQITDEQLQEESTETIAWLKENMAAVVMRRLTQEIIHAQQENDMNRLMELLEKKNKLHKK